MYESFYGLSGKPFQLNPDPAFFFGSSVHKRALAYLEYGLHQSEGFLVITGEVGAGKTMLVRTLLGKLDTKKVIAAHLVSTQLDAPDIPGAPGNAPGKSRGESQITCSRRHAHCDSGQCCASRDGRDLARERK